jgi:hypothetical protein
MAISNWSAKLTDEAFDAYLTLVVVDFENS